MKNTQEILEYCNGINQKTEQYQESVQSVSNESEVGGILDSLGIVFFTGD